MNRYSIIGSPVEHVASVGGKNVKEAPSAHVVFATLTEAQVLELRSAGYTVNEVKKVTTISNGVRTPAPVEASPTFTTQDIIELTDFDTVREFFKPPLTGEGIVVAVIDTGIRETHESVRGSIVHSKNFTSDPMADEFDHGTGVAGIIHLMAPNAGIINLKVLNSKGEGTGEEVTLAIDYLIDYVDSGGKLHVINLSIGSSDDGNPDDPMRVACREAMSRGIFVHAAAGNSGPSPCTIMSPATEERVCAIGSCKFTERGQDFAVSEFSSRGPTLEGIVKPDYVCYGENMVVASSASDTATKAASGTSFSCPTAAAIGAIALEGWGRKAEFEMEQHPRLAEVIRWTYSQNIHPLSPEFYDGYIPRITIKPGGVQGDKDNDLGWGLPYASLATLAFAAGGPGSMGIASIVAPFVSIGILGVMMKSISGVIKQMSKKV